VRIFRRKIRTPRDGMGDELHGIAQDIVNDHTRTTIAQRDSIHRGIWVEHGRL